MTRPPDLVGTLMTRAKVPLPVPMDRFRPHHGLTLEQAETNPGPSRSFPIWFPLPTPRLVTVVPTIRDTPNPRLAAARVANVESPCVTLIRAASMVIFDDDGRAVAYEQAAPWRFGSARTRNTGIDDPLVHEWNAWRTRVPRPAHAPSDFGTDRSARTLFAEAGLLPAGWRPN